MGCHVSNVTYDHKFYIKMIARVIHIKMIADILKLKLKKSADIRPKNYQSCQWRRVSFRFQQF